VILLRAVILSAAKDLHVLVNEPGTSLSPTLRMMTVGCTSPRAPRVTAEDTQILRCAQDDTALTSPGT
jgi:hypothetical protein